MSNCRKCKKLFIEALYDELDTSRREWFHAHIETCPGCSSSFQKISEALKVMDQRTSKEPEPVFWDTYWQRLLPRLNKQDSQIRIRSTWLPRLKTWQQHFPQPAVRLATAFAFLIMGIAVGKFLLPSKPALIPHPVQRVDAQGEADHFVSLEQRTEKYIEKSKVMILALVNFDPETDEPGALNLPYQKQISEELVQEANFIKTELSDMPKKQIPELITDLEVILLQIANLEMEYDLEAVEMIKTGINIRGILFKINLSEIDNINETLLQHHDDEQIQTTI